MGGKELLVGSEAEYECPETVRRLLDEWGVGFECVVRKGEMSGDGDARSNVSLDIGGHNGLPESTIGLEISGLSFEAREDRVERLLRV